MIGRIILLLTCLCIPEASSWLATITHKPRTGSLAATLVIGTNTSALSSGTIESETNPPSTTRTPLVKLTPDLLQRKAPLTRGEILKEKELTSGSLWSLNTRDSFLKAIDDKEGTEKLTVVKYHAHYCKTCQRMSIPFKQLSKSYEDVHFIRLEATEDFSSEQLRSLGVNSFPFIQVYRGSNCVASFKGGGPYFRRKIQDTIEECLKRENWEAFYKEFQQYIAENAQARLELAQKTHVLSQ